MLFDADFCYAPFAPDTERIADAEFLVTAFSALDEEQRSVVRLTYVEGYTQWQAAEWLGVDRDRVHRIHRTSVAVMRRAVRSTHRVKVAT